MRMDGFPLSRLFGRTLREAPADTATPGLGLMVRAAMVAPVEPGRYAWLPLGLRVLERARAALTAVLEARGGQPIALPAGVETERALKALLPRHVVSHRDLPCLLYVFRRQRSEAPWGLWRWRERGVLDAVLLHPDPASRDEAGGELLEDLRTQFAHTGLEVYRAEASGGVALLSPHPSGGTAVLRCAACGYAATTGAARFRLPKGASEPLQDVQAVPTPDCPTIADVAAYLGVPVERTLKAVFYATGPVGEGEVVFVVVRGDLEVSEEKLIRLLGRADLRPATEAEIRAIGAVPGYASPVGLRVRPTPGGAGALVVGDLSVRAGANFVAGANREGYHLTGVNYPRDFAVTLLEDVARARAGLPCPECGAPLEEGAAVLLASWEADGIVPFTYTDPEGAVRPVAVGRCAVEVEGWVAAVAEACRDEFGLVWPPALAPFDVHLVVLGRDEAVLTSAAEVRRALEGRCRLLWDDRDESAGVKFADADLVGCPVRLTVSRRSVEAGGVEVKARREGERRIVSPDVLPDVVVSVFRETALRG